MSFDQSLSQAILVGATILGAVVAALWIGMALWTWRDIRARTHDTLAQIAATLLVVALNIVGLIVYLMLRPRESLAEAYERSLEEEALLQTIEEKPACPGCGRPSNALWQVCPYCHTRLKKPCGQCSQMLELAWNICPFCAALQPQADAESRGRARARRAAGPVGTSASGRAGVPAAGNGAAREPAPRQAAPLEFVDGDDV
ncbi:MAG: zinc ribbon domain-containing protein [Anaerolineae bacterium]|nr:zinc ribbon domain-containing protein [Anaerolineae bacterium]